MAGPDRPEPQVPPTSTSGRCPVSACPCVRGHPVAREERPDSSCTSSPLTGVKGVIAGACDWPTERGSGRSLSEGEAHVQYHKRLVELPHDPLITSGNCMARGGVPRDDAVPLVVRAALRWEPAVIWPELPGRPCRPK